MGSARGQKKERAAARTGPTAPDVVVAATAGTGRGDEGSVPSPRERLRSRETAVKVFVAGVTFVALFPVNKTAAIAGAMLAPVVSELVTDYVQRHRWSVRRLRRGSVAVAGIGYEEDDAYAAGRRGTAAPGGGVPGGLLGGIAAMTLLTGGALLAHAATGDSSRTHGQSGTTTSTITTVSTGGRPATGGRTVVLVQTSGLHDPPAFRWHRVKKAEGYVVYRDGQPIHDTTAAQTSYTDTDAAAGTHGYQVAWVRAGAEHTPSAALAIDYEPVTKRPPFSVPTTRLHGASPTDVPPVLSWDVAAAADSYRVYRDDRFFGTTQGLSVTDGKAAVGVHTYYVTVMVGGSEGKPSNTVTVDYEPVLPAPAGLTQTPGNTAAFSWLEVPGAVAYDVYRDGKFQKQVTELSYQDADILSDGAYDYTVRAVNALGVEGTESDVLLIQLIG